MDKTPQHTTYADELRQPLTQLRNDLANALAAADALIENLDSSNASMFEDSRIRLRHRTLTTSDSIMSFRAVSRRSYDYWRDRP